MKKEKIYLIIIIILSIILIGLTIFSINNLKSTKKIVTCAKELAMLDVTYENKYIIGVGSQMEIINFKIENNYKNISDTKKEEIKKQLGVNDTSKKNNYDCQDNENFICTIETDKLLDENNEEKKYWYHTYINNLKDEGYTCSE